MLNKQNGEQFDKIVYTKVKINGKVELIWNYMPLRVDKRRLFMCFSHLPSQVINGR